MKKLWMRTNNIAKKPPMNDPHQEDRPEEMLGLMLLFAFFVLVVAVISFLLIPGSCE